MSELREVLNDVVTERQCFTGDSVKNLRTGLSFIAEIEEIQDIELITQLDSDAREAVIVHVQDRVAAGEQRRGDQITISLFGQVSKFKIARISDNPVKHQAEFVCIKIVSNVDT